MADRNKLKIADQDNIDQDDPFAELTKIMGFDPRVPMKRSEAEALQKLSAPTPVVDDFDIDLERELLGEFALDDDQPAAPVAQSVAPRQVVAPVETAAPIERREQRQEQVSAPADTVEEDDVLAEDASLDVDDFDMSEFDLSADHDAPMAMTQPERRQEEVAADVRDDDDEEAAQPLVAVDVEDAADEDRGETAAETEQQGVSLDDLDAAFAKSMDDFDDDWEPDTDPVNTVEAAEPVHAAATRSDLDMAFDAAMADVDMDFSAAPRPAAVAAEEDDLEVAESDEDDLPTLVEAAPSKPAALADDAADDDRPDFDEVSLEEEFNALLGNSAKAQPVAAAPVQQADDTVSDDLDDLDWELEARSEDDRPAAEQPVYAAEAEEADLEQLVAAAEEDEPEAEYQADSDDDDWARELEPVSVTVQKAAPVAHENDLAFDEAAFAATFAEGMDDLLPEADANRFEDEELEPVAAAPAPAEPAKEPDPFEALRRMAGSWRSAPQASPAPVQARAAEPEYEPEDEPVAAYEPEDEAEEAFLQAKSAYDDVPEIETIDVPENAIALADDLDLPELAFEEDEPAQAYDDLDAEFATLLNEMNSPEPAPVAAAAQHASRDAWLDRGRERAMPASTYAYPAAVAAGAAYASAAPAQPAQRVEEIDLGDLDLNLDDQAFDQAFATAEDGDALPDIPDYDPDFDEDLSVPGMPPVAEAPTRRGFWIAALVGGVAIAGGVGAFALSFGDGVGTDSPALVKADSSPIKVRPENPGGSVVPNQDNKVYESVANAKGPAAAPAQPPKQEKLVTTTEEPVDVAAAETDAAEAPVGFSAEEEGAAPPMAKGEDRIEQVIGEAEGAAAAEEVPTVQPRKVRTMIVKPDGSLVPADMPTPEPSTGAGLGADAQPLEPSKPAGEAVASAPEATGTVPPAAAAPADAAPVAEVPAKPKGKTQSSTTPNQVAIAPARPADQPLDIVGEVKPDQVAAIDTQPTATAVASGAWSMQIASQPSQEAAQSTYQDLARRYGGVLSGRSVNIVKAEIAGKGTFWRVRVPAQSRNDAVNLCNSYKAAGGNCFVSK